MEGGIFNRCGCGCNHHLSSYKETFILNILIKIIFSLARVEGLKIGEGGPEKQAIYLVWPNLETGIHALIREVS